MEVTEEAVICADALVLPVDPFLQRDGDAADTAAVSDRVAMVKPQLVAQHVDVEDVPVADVKADA